MAQGLDASAHATTVRRQGAQAIYDGAVAAPEAEVARAAPDRGPPASTSHRPACRIDVRRYRPRDPCSPTSGPESSASTPLDKPAPLAPAPHDRLSMQSERRPAPLPSPACHATATRRTAAGQGGWAAVPPAGPARSPA